MTDAQISRRGFLADLSRAAAAGGLALPVLAALASCARGTDSFVRLNPAEARTMRAFAAQILPSESGSPGAEEAGAVYFVDRALGMPSFADSVPIIRAGLADLDARSRTLDGRGGFASLPSARQIAIMRQVEHEPYFALARGLVVIGTFADPSYGGNRNGIGWAMIGMEHRPAFTAPFGWYDAQSGTVSTNAA